MPNASTLGPDSRFMALFVGKSGSGKTPAACSFCAEGKVLDYDFDGRIRGLLGCPWVDRFKVDYNPYPVVSDTFGPAWSRLNKDLEVIQIQARNGQLPYKTLVLDSLTSQTFAFLKDAMSFSDNKGHKIGPLRMSGPNDFNFQATGTQDVISFLKSVPGINIIITAHIVDEYGPIDPEDPYKGSQKIGTKLALTDKLGASIPGGFDHVFEFERRMQGDTPKFGVRFWSDIARTTFPNFPLGWVDVTNKNFYNVLQDLIKKGAEIEANKSSK